MTTAIKEPKGRQIRSKFAPTLLTHPKTGKSQTRIQWAEELGISLAALHQRIHRDRIGVSSRKWWEDSRSGPAPIIPLLPFREYVHKGSNVRYWLESFTEPDDDGQRSVKLRTCSRNKVSVQSIPYDRLFAEFRLIGSRKPHVTPLTPAQLDARANEANQFYQVQQFKLSKRKTSKKNEEIS